MKSILQSGGRESGLFYAYNIGKTEHLTETNIEITEYLTITNLEQTEYLAYNNHEEKELRY